MIYACKKLVNRSKYIDNTAGKPTCKIGIDAITSLGIHERTTELSDAKPPYTSEVITIPAAIFPK